MADVTVAPPARSGGDDPPADQPQAGVAASVGAVGDLPDDPVPSMADEWWRHRPPATESDLRAAARRSFVMMLVAVGVVAAAVALWQLKLVLTLVFLAMIIAAAMRPGVDALARRRIPRGVGVTIHYLGLIALIGLFLWFALPRALSQVEAAVGGAPTSTAQLKVAAAHATGVKHELLIGIEKRLKKLPSARSLVHPALSITTKAFEVLVYFVFVFACAAYWIFERDSAVDLITSLVARPKRKRIRDTFDLIDAKLGAFVRGELLLIVFVATLLSLLFWAVGEPYWILLGPFAGVMELVPVIGPLAAGAVAIVAGFTSSWHVALAAGIAVLVVRIVEDYLVSPRVLGHAVGLSPFLIIVSVLSVEILFGGVAVLLAIPIAAVLATIVDVTVRGRDPAEEDVPTVLFTAHDSE
jgi:predicted PurR-regulated permease PerM